MVELVQVPQIVKIVQGHVGDEQSEFHAHMFEIHTESFLKDSRSIVWPLPWSIDLRIRDIRIDYSHYVSYRSPSTIVTVKLGAEDLKQFPEATLSVSIRPEYLKALEIFVKEIKQSIESSDELKDQHQQLKKALDNFSKESKLQKREADLGYVPVRAKVKKVSSTQLQVDIDGVDHTLFITPNTNMHGYSLDNIYGCQVDLIYDKFEHTMVTISGLFINDERDNLQASFYTGMVIDSFAAEETKKFLDPEGSGDIRLRGVFGVNFAYRIIGSAAKSKDAKSKQLWVYGETVHGARSAEVECEPGSKLELCGGKEALKILRNATSLEGFVGLRFEFYGLREGSASPGKIYIKLQAGFLTVAESGGDVVDVHHGAVGGIVTKGRFRDSYIEVGFGKTDLFVKRPNDRWKLDGLLTWNSRWLGGKGISPFIQITVDSDLGNGADSIQTYIGFDFDMDHLFGADLKLKGL